jgi:presenilin-like A22 family membrane protease
MVYFAATSTRNGVLQSGVGVNFPKGLIVACGGVSFSKDGIAAVLSDYDIVTAIGARLLGIVDTLFSAIAFPFAILSYLVLMVIGILSWVLFWPFAICAWKSPTPHSIAFKAYMMSVGIFALFGIPSILITVVLMVLTPFQILVPELTVFVLQIHRWSRQE